MTHNKHRPLHGLKLWEPNHFGDADTNLTATTNSNLPITYLSSDSAVAQIVDAKWNHQFQWYLSKVVGAGTANITATQAGNGIHAASPVSKSVTVTKASQTIVTK